MSGTAVVVVVCAEGQGTNPPSLKTTTTPPPSAAIAPSFAKVINSTLSLSEVSGRNAQVVLHFSVVHNRNYLL